MRQTGYTVLEMLIVIAVIGVVASIGFPHIRRALDKSNVRSARIFLGTAAVTARQSAGARLCRAVVHFTSGTNGSVWVTACPRFQSGSGSVDTLGPVEPLASRYNVTLTATRDSVQFDPRGLSLDNANTTVSIRGASAATLDSVLINPIGMVVRQ